MEIFSCGKGNGNGFSYGFVLNTLNSEKRGSFGYGDGCGDGCGNHKGMGSGRGYGCGGNPTSFDIWMGDFILEDRIRVRNLELESLIT